MATFSAEVWMLLAAIVGAAVLAILHCMAITVRNEHKFHELKLKAARVRAQMAAQLAAANDANVIYVDEAPDESAAQPVSEAA